MHANPTGLRAGLAAVAATAAVVACLIPAVSGSGPTTADTGAHLAARAVTEPPGPPAPSTEQPAADPTSPQPSGTPARRTPTHRPRAHSAAPPRRQVAAPVAERPAHHAAPKPARPAPRRPTHRAASTHPAASGYQASSIAYSVLSQLNAQRHQVGAAALHMNSELITSAHRHNLAMAAANEMSHQLPGEAYFADRIRAAGYSYHYAGENIAWNSDTSTSGALELGSDMFAEGPGGEHYVNITSKHFVDVGVDVYIDTVHHKLWLTEDFGSR